ncbi:MAG: hypothetical protein WA080_00725 [Sulfuricurvum sp.]
MDIELGIQIIKNVAQENGYQLTSGESSFEIFKNTLRPKSLKIKKINDDLLIYQWEDEKEDYSTNSVYSLRTLNDVIKFCNILSISTEIRSGRNRV